MLQRRHGDASEPGANLKERNIACRQPVGSMFRHVVHGPCNRPIQRLGELNRIADGGDEALTDAMLSIDLHELSYGAQGTFDEVAVVRDALAR